jgi:hypothetical protein
MQKKTCALLVIVIVGAAAILYTQFWSNPNNPPGGEDGFDNGGRYDSTNLDYMGVIYTNRSDILNWNGGYSESTNCPWGAIHNGLDFAFANGSSVIAAAPGYVEEILVTDTGPVDNVYMVHVSIRFNESIQVSYVFEPWTTNESVVARVIAGFDIEVGDWVAKGDQIATFLQIGGGAHIHFGIYNGEATCPIPFFSEDAYTEIMALVHSFHSDWNLCYP